MIWLLIAAFSAGVIVTGILAAALALSSAKDDLEDFHNEFYREH